MGSGSSRNSSNPDEINLTPSALTQSELTEIYNKKIIRMDLHGAVRVMTSDGEIYFVHKGNGFGRSGGQTVVVKGEFMSDSYEIVDTRWVDDTSMTVADAVKAGGRDYKLTTDNCNHAALRIFNFGLEQKGWHATVGFSLPLQCTIL